MNNKESIKKYINNIIDEMSDEDTEPCMASYGYPIHDRERIIWKLIREFNFSKEELEGIKCFIDCILKEK